MYNKETISFGSGLTKKSDNVHRPDSYLHRTSIILYSQTVVLSLSWTGMSNIRFSFMGCWCCPLSGALPIVPLLLLGALSWLRDYSTFLYTLSKKWAFCLHWYEKRNKLFFLNPLQLRLIPAQSNGNIRSKGLNAQWQHAAIERSNMAHHRLLPGLTTEKNMSVLKRRPQHRRMRANQPHSDLKSSVTQIPADVKSIKDKLQQTECGIETYSIIGLWDRT